MEITFIYALFCPLSGKMKYIGKANQPHKRVKEHMYDIRGMTSEKIEWVGQLRKHNKKPILEILDEVEIKKWEFWEGFYIDYFKSLGIQLINTNRKGNGLKWANHQTFKPGNRPWNKNKIKMGSIYV
jgi:predicted GIY-YIG superfamily endonuclease